MDPAAAARAQYLAQQHANAQAAANGHHFQHVPLDQYKHGPGPLQSPLMSQRDVNANVSVPMLPLVPSERELANGGGDSDSDEDSYVVRQV